MMRLANISLTTILMLALCSCTDNDATTLKHKLSKPIEPPTASHSLTRSTIAQYRDAELAYNERYMLDLKRTLDNSFKKQLDKFEDNELGFFSSYANMFNYIFMSRQKFEDSWKVKSSKYFNSLDIENDALDCYQVYIKNVSAIRGNFYRQQNNQSLPAMAKLDLPSQDIYLGNIKEHSRNNLLIEVGVEALVWLLILLIVFILSLIFTVPTGGISLIATVLTIIISVILSIANDKKMLNSLREQNTVIMEADYSAILKTLNDNTYQFYGN